MKYGLGLPTGGECGDPTFLVELARRAEDAGWDGLFLEDYVCYQRDPAAPTCDTWTVLAAIAVQTSRIILGSSVTPLPRRRPWNVARQVAAVDQLSGGRAVLGVGIGDAGEAIANDASLSRFGGQLDTRIRAEMLDEGLEIIAGLWSGEEFRFKGRHYAVEGVTFAPLPVQKPRVPVWVGGCYPDPGPTRRAARWDGWMLYKGGARRPVARHDAGRRPGAQGDGRRPALRRHGRRPRAAGRPRRRAGAHQGCRGGRRHLVRRVDRPS